MKQHITKRIIMAVVLSFIMILGIGASVFAEGETPATATENPAISITNAKGGSTYSIYQIMTAQNVGTDNNGNNLYAFTVTDDFKGFFENNTDGYGLNEQNQITKDGTVLTGDTRTTNSNSSEASKLASALSKYAQDNNKAAIGEIKSATDVLTPGLGYYVIAETESSENAAKDDSGAKEVAIKPILVDLTQGSIDVTLKDDTTKLDKVIVEDGEEVKSNNVDIGDTVNYKITTKIPNYEANVDKTKLMFKLTDIFSKGLTYNEESLDIPGFTKDTDYTATYANQELTIEFTQDAIYNNQGKEVVATYSAILNENAKVDNTDGNDNKVKLEYTNNTNEEESHKTLNDETKTFTYGFNVRKVDKVAPSTGLADAKFKLKDEEGNTIKFTKTGNTYVVNKDDTDETAIDEIVSVGGEGLATIEGLDEGKYYLEETQAPDKYTKLAGDVTIIIADKKDAEGKNPIGVATLTAGGAGSAKAEGGSDVVDEDGNPTGTVESNGSTININVYVENAKGISLPETGRNTALYCMIGGVVLVILGAAYYILGARKKAAK